MKRAFVAMALAAFAAAAAADGGHSHSHARAGDASFGRAADPKKAKRTVRVEMNDQMRFVPGEITVRRGEVVRFVPVNKGKVMHEMVLGTMADLKEHAEAMRKQPGMQHHDASGGAHVAPGKSGEIGWQFTRAGEFYYGCLIPGHFEAGMIGKVTVR